MIQGFYDDPSVNLDDLDRVLVKVITDNKDKVISWFKDEAGSWGFLAGKAVTAYRPPQFESHSVEGLTAV